MVLAINSASIAAMAAAVAAIAAIIALVFVSKQIRDARRTFQGQTMLQMILEIQDDKGPRAARKILYELTSGRTKISLADLYRRRDEVEPALHVINSIALLVDEGMIPERPIIGDWGGLIARCWCASKGLVTMRRSEEGRPDLWKLFEVFGEKCLAVERMKDHNAQQPVWWIRDYDRSDTSADVQEALREIRDEERQ